MVVWMDEMGINKKEQASRTLGCCWVTTRAAGKTSRWSTSQTARQHLSQLLATVRWQGWRRTRRGRGRLRPTPPSSSSLIRTETASQSKSPWQPRISARGHWWIASFQTRSPSKGGAGGEAIHSCGGRSNQSVTSRCGSLLPSASADARSSGDVVEF